MASTRNTVIAAVETRMATILTSGGYRTNIGRKVRSWQFVPPNWDDLPVLMVTDPDDEIAPPAYGTLEHRLKGKIEVIMPGNTTTAELRDLGADILQAIGTDPTFSDNVRETVVTKISITPGEPDVVDAGVTVELDVVYESGLWIM